MSSPKIGKLDYQWMFSQVENLGQNNTDKLYFTGTGDLTRRNAKGAGFLTRLFNWGLTNKRLNEDRATFLEGIRQEYGEGLYGMAKATAEAAGTYGITAATANQILKTCKLLQNLKTDLDAIQGANGDKAALVCSEIVMAKIASQGGDKVSEASLRNLINSVGMMIEKPNISAKDAVVLGKMLASVDIPSNAAKAMIKAADKDIEDKYPGMHKGCKLQNLLRGCKLLFSRNNESLDWKTDKGLAVLAKLAPYLDKLVKRDNLNMMAAARAVLVTSGVVTSKDFNQTYCGNFYPDRLLGDQIDVLHKLLYPKDEQGV